MKQKEREFLITGSYTIKRQTPLINDGLRLRLAEEFRKKYRKEVKHGNL